MYSYLKIVFGIKHKYRISDVLGNLKQHRFYSILISEHNAMDVDNCCNRPDVHYHGVVEFSNGEGKMKNVIMSLSPYFIYVNVDECSSPAEYLAYITLAPKRIIAQEILNSSELLNYLQTASKMKSDVLRRKRDRRISVMERDHNVVEIIDFLLKYGSIGNVLNQFKNNDPFSARVQTLFSFKDGTHDTALSVSRKIVLNSSILVLSDRFESRDGYLSPEESATIVLDWCSYQKLDPKAFVKDLIRCLDKRGGNRNTIYLQGSRNSGKTWIVESVIEACIHVGQVMVESSAYPFVWEKCVDKRLIVLREPHFSLTNFDQLDKVLSGSGTLIYKHNNVVDYLSPTPVIILANEQDWIDDPQLSEKIKKRFLCCYMNLKSFPYISEKKLHPQWLNLLNKTFSCINSSKADQKDSKISYGSPLKSNPGANNGMQIISDVRLIDGDKKAGHSLKMRGDCDLFPTKISMNSKRGSENTMPPNPNNRKRPMRDIEDDGVGNKMTKVYVMEDEPERGAA